MNIFNKNPNLIWLTGVLIVSALGYGMSAHAQNKKWTLKECINEALEKNITLNQNELNDEINKINYNQSKANLYPNLNFNDGHALYFGHSINPSNNQYAKQNYSENTPALSSSVTLFNGSRNFNLIEENKLIYQAGNLDIEKMKNDLTLNVIAAYLQVLYEYEAVNIIQYQENATSEQVTYTQKYVAVGNKPQSSLFQIQAQLAANKAAKVNADNQLQLAKVVLMQIMQMPLTNDFEVELPDSSSIIPVPVLASSIDIYNTAASVLPNVKSAKVKTDAAIAALKVTKAELIPKLTLSGGLYTYYSSLSSTLHTTEQIQTIGYLKDNPSEQVVGPVGVTNTSGYPLFNQFKDNFGQSIALNLSIPIFNNLQFKSDIKKAHLAIKNAQLNESLAGNMLRQAIEQAYTDQLGASKTYMATKEQMQYEEKYYNDLQKQLKQGMATMTDYLVAQNNYYGAVVSNVQAKYQYMFKSKVLAFYTGELIIK